ncbi:MAG: 2-C-methyl-D-erythritol 4-phosphate cytidylyltransferase [Chryseolinea sp.]
MHSKEVAIIVAGGKGLRLPGDLPKQFIEIGGLPVLMHTVNAFRTYDASMDIILVLPQAEISLWEELCQKHPFNRNVIVCPGGSSRFESVKNGLSHVSGPGLVAVHDGVRPLITPDVIGASFDIARKHRSAVASVPLKESIRQVESSPSATSFSSAELSDQRSVALDRTRFRLMQTPQTFDIGLLKSAYASAKGDSFTDDASVVESAGHAVVLYDGSYENIKITTPEDLMLAEAIILARQRK